MTISISTNWALIAILFLLYSCLQGAVSVQIPLTGGGHADFPLRSGETMLVPASLDTLTLTPAPGGAHLLQVHLPQPPKDDVYDGPEPGISC